MRWRNLLVHHRLITNIFLAVSLFTTVTLVFKNDTRAETRGEPYSEEFLLENSARVFVGEVLETTTFEDYQRTIPTQARVLISIKGDVPLERIVVLPKHPGKYAYFDEEFSQAQPGRTGLFYVGFKDQADLLMAYKQLPDRAASE